MLIIQPVVSVSAGFLQNFIGRKSGMILMNIAELISWVTLYTATTVNMLYASAIMMGISAGLNDAPGLPYIGEITEPRLRGLISSFVCISLSVGFLIEFLLCLFVDWRTAAAISAVVPVVSITMMAFVSRNR